MNPSSFIVIYITCESKDQAEKIGRHLLENRLCGCVNIFENMTSISWWPPKEKKLSKGKETVLLVKTLEKNFKKKETVLLVKTLEKNFKKIESEVIKIHSWKVPCIFSIKNNQVHQPYLKWLEGEID